MKILFLGPDWGTSRHRRQAIERLGHQVTYLDPISLVSGIPKANFLLYHTGGWGVAKLIDWQLRKRFQDNRFDMVFVNGGESLCRSAVAWLRSSFNHVINYNHENPFNFRDKHYWDLYLKAIPAYSLLAIRSHIAPKEAYKLGAKHVTNFMQSADEILHRPLDPFLDAEKWQSEVLFVGTYMPERGPFIMDLIERGVPLTIYGDGWKKSEGWEKIKVFFKGSAVYETDYVKAIQGAKICLGLVSKDNLDLHTRRSVEIPAIGSLLCAQRTDEHSEMYQEGEEAVFWNNSEECATTCLNLLSDPDRLHAISQKGHQRCLANGHFNEPVLHHLIQEALSLENS